MVKGYGEDQISPNKYHGESVDTESRPKANLEMRDERPIDMALQMLDAAIVAQEEIVSLLAGRLMPVMVSSRPEESRDGSAPDGSVVYISIRTAEDRVRDLTDRLQILMERLQV